MPKLIYFHLTIIDSYLYNNLTEKLIFDPSYRSFLVVLTEKGRVRHHFKVLFSTQCRRIHRRSQVFTSDPEVGRNIHGCGCKGWGRYVYARDCIRIYKGNQVGGNLVLGTTSSLPNPPRALIPLRSPRVDTCAARSVIVSCQILCTHPGFAVSLPHRATRENLWSYMNTFTLSHYLYD